jgi:hypothetical protein
LTVREIAGPHSLDQRQKLLRVELRLLVDVDVHGRLLP